jgi:hypothetical protein
MADKATWRTREQQAQADFSRAIQQFRPYIEDLPEGPRAIDAMTKALLRFGTCEVRTRRAGRLRALDMSEPEAAAWFKSALAHHERGLAALPHVRPIAAAFAAQPADEQDLAPWREPSPAILADWHEQLVGLDIRESDAMHLARIMRECHEAVGVDGLPGLGPVPDRAARRARDGPHVRRSRDTRGLVSLVKDCRRGDDPRPDRVCRMGFGHERCPVVGLRPRGTGRLRDAAARDIGLLTTATVAVRCAATARRPESIRLAGTFRRSVTTITPSKRPGKERNEDQNGHGYLQRGIYLRALRSHYWRSTAVV